jgi:phosphohistidine phosphatase SixA
MKRRHFVGWGMAGASALGGSAAWSQNGLPTGPAEAQTLLRAGACAVLLRHAQTVPGIGDPAGFRIDFCSTQRNLSETGRASSRRIGNWFKNRQLQPRAVLSSAWCRCRDTADLAFGRHMVWTALNSTFNDPASQAAQTIALRDALVRLPSGQFEVWVTHQVNITALTGEVTGMSEALIVDSRGRIMLRTHFG